jgi:hypothetical protein
MQITGSNGCRILETMLAEYWKQCMQNSGNNGIGFILIAILVWILPECVEQIANPGLDSSQCIQLMTNPGLDSLQLHLADQQT